MAKKRVMKSMDKGENCGMYGCNWCWTCMKLSVVAFVLFLLTVWPWLNNVLMSVHWGWYLAITIVLLIVKFACRCRKQ